MSTSALGVSVNEFLQGVIARTGIPGISIAIGERGSYQAFAAGVASTDGKASLTEQMRFQIGCITKLLTGILVLRFAQEGKLNLDAPVSEYLPELGQSRERSVITVRLLAFHASGRLALNLADTQAGYFYSWDKFVRYFADTPQTFAPGTVFNYDHTDHVILGRILQQLSGRTFEELCLEHFFEPHGILYGHVGDTGDDAALNVPDHELDPATRVYKRLRSVPYCPFWESSLSRLTLSPGELMQLVLATVIGGNPESRMVRHLTERAVALPRMCGGPRAEQLPLWFGLGCAEYSQGTFGHNGSARGQTSGFRFDPELGIAVAVSINAWQPYVRDLVLNTLLESLRPQASQAKPQTHGIDVSESAASLCGRYAGGVSGNEIVVSTAGDRLALEIQSRYGRGGVRLEIDPGRNGGGLVSQDVPYLSVGFFLDPKDQGKALMVGLNAFKRVGS